MHDDPAQSVVLCLGLLKHIHDDSSEFLQFLITVTSLLSGLPVHLVLFHNRIVLMLYAFHRNPY